jgi:dTDP-4-dehydrorhamnose reductase
VTGADRGGAPVRRWFLVGASGFVGRAIAAELGERGEIVVALRAPRIDAGAAASVEALIAVVEDRVAEYSDFLANASGSDVVVNAAGLALPDELSDGGSLYGANAVLPGILALLSATRQVRRFVHISSAAVQGPAAVLDTSPETRAFSPYSRSKAMGEAVLTCLDLGALDCTIVRATSVHGPGRATTRSFRRIARSPLASVASPGTQPTAVSSVYGLADFIVAVGLYRGIAPPIVLQPWETMTVSSVLQLAGQGHRPIVLPSSLCRRAVTVGRIASRLLGGRLAGTITRLEILWFGQAQSAPGIEFTPRRPPIVTMSQALSRQADHAEGANRADP